jgi:hypothetical protein
VAELRGCNCLSIRSPIVSAPLLPLSSRLLLRPDHNRCQIHPPQHSASALELPENFALQRMKAIEAQAGRAAMAELAALPYACQQCDPQQP